jgi:septal ring factor EnvC (AmiA/AmiB activator)
LLWVVLMTAQLTAVDNGPVTMPEKSHLDQIGELQREITRLKRQVRYRNSELTKVREELAKRTTEQSPAAQLEAIYTKLRNLLPPLSANEVELRAQITAWEAKWNNAWEELGREANRHGLCGVYDQVCRRLGGVPRPGRGGY